MGNILYIIEALIMLCVIIVVHEFGHYLAGRLCGIGIVEFSVGFGPKILGFKKKDIQYSLRCVPLGGFCKFVGEDSDNSAPNAMNNQAVWKRFITVFSGPLLNFVFAYIVCILLMMNYFTAELLPFIDTVIDSAPAMEAGFQEDDVVVSINGNEISYDNDGALEMREIVQNADLSVPLEFVVNRDGRAVNLSVTPELKTENGVDSYQIGIMFGSRTYSFTEAVRGAGGFMVDCTKLMLDAIKNLVFKGEGINEMSGPVGIIAFATDYFREGWYMVLYIAFIISLNLGIMNLLPLPALDGGRLIFLIVEAIRRKPIPPEKEGIVHAAGFALLLILMLVLTYKDIAKLITG